ncbi:hypothetical protein F5B20DRAFT_122961 [Whalleya microplaca]|nr:hypothetical protein F5B20DRAFT_122961 [Whalleya microplaca]
MDATSQPAASVLNGQNFRGNLHLDSNAPRTLPPLQVILKIHPICARLMRFLDTKDILRLRQTSWSIRLDIMANEWNINSKLGRFIKYPTEFRSQLGRFDALISGGFALQFLERVVWPESDLDIMVQDGENLEGLARFLVEVEGYEMTDNQVFTEADDNVTMTQLASHQRAAFRDMKKCQTYFYRNENVNTGNNFKNTTSKIQLIATSDSPLKAILTGNYTTALVNFISWNKAYAIFPRATFLSHETVPLKDVNEYFGALHAKYSQRGWRMRSEPVVDGPYLGPFFLGDRFLLGNLQKPDRRVGDKDTWILRLDTTSVQPPSKPDFVLEYSSFELIKIYDKGQSVILEDLALVDFNEMWWKAKGTDDSLLICADTFRSPSLKYTFVYPTYQAHRGERGPYELWEHLRKRLAHNTLCQLSKMKRSRVEELLAGGLNIDVLNNLQFEHPKGWDY